MRPLVSLTALALSASLSVPAFAQKMDNNDAAAMKQLAQANLNEIEAGKMAAAKAQNPEVKQFGQKMADDHARMFEDLKRLAKTKDVALPDKAALKDLAQNKVIERKSGAGKLILAAFSAGTKDSDLPFRPAFVPLIHQLVASLAGGRDARRQVIVGEPIEARFPVGDAGKPIRIAGPGGLTAVRTGSLAAGGVSITYSDTTKAGNSCVSQPKP